MNRDIIAEGELVLEEGCATVGDRRAKKVKRRCIVDRVVV